MNPVYIYSQINNVGVTSALRGKLSNDYDIYPICCARDNVLDRLFPSVTSSIGEGELLAALSGAAELADAWALRCDSVAHQLKECQGKLPAVLDGDVKVCSALLGSAAKLEAEVRTTIQHSDGTGIACP